MTDQSLTELIAGIPKAELHVHQVGSASPRIVADLAARHPDTPVPKDADELADYFVFTDFAKFVEIYLSVVDLVRTGEDVRLLTYEVAQEMAGQHIRYAELTCTPYTSVIRGIPATEFCEAIEDARTAAERDFGLVLRWCFDIPGESGLPAAEETLRIALEEAPAGLVAFGLGGPEIGVPRPQFKPYFDQARAAGLHSAPHAGESTGPETVWSALTDLGAERIGHGTSAYRDPDLLSYLAERRIGVEVCPTSNIATRVVESLAEHPLTVMADAGVPLTIGSDDPPMFGTTLVRELGIAADYLHLDAAGLVDLVKAGVDLSFADEALRSRLHEEIDRYVEQQRTPGGEPASAAPTETG